MNSAPNSERRVLLWVSAVALVLIVAVSVLSPAHSRDDPTPTVDNSGTGGARAAFLALPSLGFDAVRYTGSLDELANADASHTTLILADPTYSPNDRQKLASAIAKFLSRGGRVLATDDSGGVLLPEGGVGKPSFLHNGLCYTHPEGPAPLAATGEVEIADRGRWTGDPAALEDQRCGNDAVVVHYAVGKGEAIWWSSATPLSNSGLKTDADLRLLLASLGDPHDANGNPRHVLFDEALHGAPPDIWKALSGLPLFWLGIQAALVFLLLIASFSRRRGPLREAVVFPRSSPTEFARSMGSLYARAGATAAATDAAKAHLLRILRREAGLNPHTLTEGPSAIAEALTSRLRGDWSTLAKHLQQANDAGRHPLDPKSALALVRALRNDEDSLRRVLNPEPQSG